MIKSKNERCDVSHDLPSKNACWLELIIELSIQNLGRLSATIFSNILDIDGVMNTPIVLHIRSQTTFMNGRYDEVFPVSEKCFV